eukprot:maker-scaffold275_size226830-snap-gene-1.26 protein:Tk00636 transcript:maker-scaffold275_size226830-snap-gene-1.26-mRNA-1 annotation:"protein jagged-1"
MIWFLLLLVPLSLAQPRGGPRGLLLTPLRIEELPCVAENLRESYRYICDDEANVICLSGWMEKPNGDDRDIRNPCPIPICDYQGETCSHGECVRPDVCACDVGWAGHLCNHCIPLPGCQHGSCNGTLECNCDSNDDGLALWEGAFCDQPACPDCDPSHGFCFQPFACQCFEGWEGEDCQECVKLPGCLHGDCEGDHPHTCECEEGWTGHLCDQPICSVGCHPEHGFCFEPDTCICQTGWQGDTCAQCVSYWTCPSSGECIEPNQCICDSDAVADDNENVCNRDRINGPMHAQDYTECSVPCAPFTAFEVSSEALITGNQTRACLWGEEQDLCEPIVRNCQGTQLWAVDTNMVDDNLDFELCLFYDPNSD